MVSAQESIAVLLQTANFGTLGSSIFVDYKPTTPSCIVVTAYEGGNSLLGLGSRTPIYRTTKVQVTVRNPSQATAMSTANSIVTYLDALTNVSSDGVAITSIYLASGPFFIGKDRNENTEYTINFKLTWR